MSKWGAEEKETIKAIEKLGVKGKILDIAAGDGRFIEILLKRADKVVAVDISEKELEELKENCPKELKNKLDIRCMDITKKFPFEQNTFDGVFCTGTLHLFDAEEIKVILNEIKRVLKNNGKILLDFATDILRLDCENNPVVFENEGNYTTKQAIKLFQDTLKDFTINIEEAKFKEENLDESAGYHSIVGNFLIISGEYRDKIFKVENER